MLQGITHKREVTELFDGQLKVLTWMFTSYTQDDVYGYDNDIVVDSPITGYQVKMLS